MFHKFTLGLTTVAVITLGFSMPITSAAFAQEAVVAAPDTEALFTSPDPKLHRNKQAAYKIIKELLEANHWERADLYLTERYIQHNPNAASGRQALVDYFTKVIGVKPTPIPEKMQSQIAFVIAEGDLVTVAMPLRLKDPTNPGKFYSTTWFDTWRFVDGKADEHWDGAMKEEETK